MAKLDYSKCQLFQTWSIRINISSAPSHRVSAKTQPSMDAMIGRMLAPLSPRKRRLGGLKSEARSSTHNSKRWGYLFAPVLSCPDPNEAVEAKAEIEQSQPAARHPRYHGLLILAIGQRYMLARVDVFVETERALPPMLSNGKTKRCD